MAVDLRYRKHVLGIPDLPTMIRVLHSDEIWGVIARHMRANRWTPLAEVYGLVEHSLVLDAEDMEPDSPGSSGPRWKRNVRNVLQRRKTEGDLDWDGAGCYRLP